MRNLKHRLRVARRNESGATLIIVAMVLVVLMGMAAFAVDYGWLYWNGIKIQHGADAAALSGVIYEPDNRALAHSEAQAAALENGYDDASASTQVTPLDFTDDPSAVENPFQLSVAVSDAVPTFFMKIFGFSSVTITKRAVAEYIRPLNLGSPTSQFGNAPGCTPGLSGGGSCPGIWASIQGDINGRGYGDKYSSKCKNWNTNSSPACTVDNPNHRDRGYIFGIDVPVGETSPRVRLFDPAFNPDGNGASPIFDRWSAGNTTNGHSVTYTLYKPTPTPLVLSSTEPVPGCSKTYTAGTWEEAAKTWETLCNAGDFGSGIYPLQVRVSSTGTVGHNRFSIRAFTQGGVNPSVYAIGDFSLYSQQTPGTAEFYLAEVGPEHAGKTLVLNLWDIGDAQSGAWVQPLMPGGATHPCTWTGIRGDNGNTWTNLVLGSNENTCKIVTDFNGNTSTSRYNNSDLRIEIDLTGYTCSSDCWWKIRIRYPSSSTDTTTWEAHIDGNPVKLVK